MKRIIVLCAAMLLVLGMAATSFAVTVNFEDLTIGSSYASLTYGPVVFTNTMGNLSVYGSPGAPLSGNVILGPNTHNANEWYVATFSSAVNQVSVDLGDWDADADNLLLQAFNSSNVLIASASAINPADVNGGLTLSVSAPGIAYVLFNETSNPGFQGSIFFDNFTYNAVPEPATLLLFGAGLLGLGAAKRKLS
jgi:hypothetical protein